jgi:hypothetical protein
MRTAARSVAVRIAGVLVTLSTSACTGGINAGEDGGVAFIVLAVMLVAILGILWLVLGRED